MSLALALFLASAPKLGVVVVFDQLRPVELDRYAPFFGEGGFGGIDGARFDALYAFTATETGPGHATLLTCANPDVHGIATNAWFRGGEKRYAVDDASFPTFGVTDNSGRSPKTLVAPTLGDAMKAESNGRAKVVTISHKDRAAILSGGQSADLAVWYDTSLGQFTTSKFYVDALPAWLADKGKALPARSQATAKWTALPVPPSLKHLVPPDDRDGEGGHEGFDRTFPHDVTDAPEPLRRKIYRMTPNAMEDLFSLALIAVDEMQLGKDDEPDLLVVSVSTTDYIGHNYGPDSLEQLETLRHADAALRRFVRALDDKVGRKKYGIVVTSDHGSTPPPLSVKGRVPHGFIAVDAIDDAVQTAIRKVLPNDKRKRALGFIAPQLFLDLNDLPPADSRRLLDAVIVAVEAIPGVHNVYDMTVDVAEDPWWPFMKAAAFRGRHAPLFVLQQPRIVFLHDKSKLGTDHGTPYTYDKRIPLLVGGPGVKRGRFAQPVDARDVAPTLAFILGVPPPDMCAGKPVSAVGD